MDDESIFRAAVNASIEGGSVKTADDVGFDLTKLGSLDDFFGIKDHVENAVVVDLKAESVEHLDASIDSNLPIDAVPKFTDVGDQQLVSQAEITQDPKQDRQEGASSSTTLSEVSTTFLEEASQEALTSMVRAVETVFVVDASPTMKDIFPKIVDLYVKEILEYLESPEVASLTDEKPLLGDGNLRTQHFFGLIVYGSYPNCLLQRSTTTSSAKLLDLLSRISFKQREYLYSPANEGLAAALEMLSSRPALPLGSIRNRFVVLISNTIPVMSGIMENLDSNYDDMTIPDLVDVMKLDSIRFSAIVAKSDIKEYENMLNGDEYVEATLEESHFVRLNGIAIPKALAKKSAPPKPITTKKRSVDEVQTDSPAKKKQKVGVTSAIPSPATVKTEQHFQDIPSITVKADNAAVSVGSEPSLARVPGKVSTPRSASIPTQPLPTGSPSLTTAPKRRSSLSPAIPPGAVKESPANSKSKSKSRSSKHGSNVGISPVGSPPVQVAHPSPNTQTQNPQQSQLLDINTLAWIGTITDQSTGQIQVSVKALTARGNRPISDYALHMWSPTLRIATALVKLEELKPFVAELPAVVFVLNEDNAVQMGELALSKMRQSWAKMFDTLTVKSRGFVARFDAAPQHGILFVKNKDQLIGLIFAKIQLSKVLDTQAQAQAQAHAQQLLAASPPTMAKNVGGVTNKVNNGMPTFNLSPPMTGLTPQQLQMQLMLQLQQQQAQMTSQQRSLLLQQQQVALAQQIQKQQQALAAAARGMGNSASRPNNIQGTSPVINVSTSVSPPMTAIQGLAPSQLGRNTMKSPNNMDPNSRLTLEELGSLFPELPMERLVKLQNNTTRGTVAQLKRMYDGQNTRIK